MTFEQLLQRIMDSNVNFRHSIVADNKSIILSVNHRPRVTNYLSEEETTFSLKRADNAWKAQKELSSKIGTGLYAVAAFEKITRITIPFVENNLLFVSMGSEKLEKIYTREIKNKLRHTSGIY